MQASSDERTRELEEAADWVLRLDKHRSAECDAEFRRWVIASPTHMAAFLVAKVGFQKVMQLETARHILLRTLAASGAETIPHTLVPASSGAVTPRRSSRGIAVGVAAAVAGVLAITAAWSVLGSWQSSNPADSHRRTYIQPGLVRLGSDSTMLLGEHPRAEVTYLEGGKGARVNLFQGTALFSGRHFDANQLQVIVSHAVIEVLGTEFEVRRDQVVTKVAVKDGSVKVNSDCQLPQAAEMVHDGKEIILGRGQSIVIPSESCNGPSKVSEGSSVATATARLPGLAQPQAEAPSPPEWIAFSATTIGDAVSAFNLRNSGHRLVVSDRALANRRIGGRFRTSDPEGFVDYLIHSLGAQVTRDLAPDGSMVIKLFAPKKRISRAATPLLPIDTPHRNVQSS